MKRNLLRFIFIFFSVAWVIFVLLDYMNKHPRHVMGYQYFKLGSYLVGIGVVYGLHIGLHFLLKKYKISLDRFLNGIWVVSVFLVCSLIEYLSFSEFLESKPEFHHYVFMLGRTLKILGGGMVIIFSALVIGNFVLNKCKLQWPARSLIADIAVGCLLIVQIILLMSFLGIFRKEVLIAAAVAAMALNYKNLLPLTKSMFLDSWVKPDKYFFISMGLTILLISFASINLQSILAPFPFGFDSRNVYLNISHLVAEHGSLVEGFQPYPWSLFLSLGFAVFNMGEIAFFLSFFSGILCLLYMYRLCRVYFNLDQLYSLLAVTLFFITPAITNQFFIELKVDFGLLLFQLFSLDIVLYLLKNGYLEIDFQSKPARSMATTQSKLPWKFLILLGIVSGFALTIKLTHFFILFAIIIAIWTKLGSRLGFYASFSFLMALILFLRLDDLSGLRQYHLGVDQLKWILLFTSFGLFAPLIYYGRSIFIQSAKITLAIGFCSIIVLSPWMVKGYLDTGSLNPKTLILGSAPGPQMNLRQLELKYSEMKENN